MKELRVIGLMSGTSVDGIDAALLRTDGENAIAREGFVSIPYAAGLREKIRACFGKTPEAAREAEAELTYAHAQAVGALLDKLQMDFDDIDLIGFHGQTISHAPERGHTCQLGDGPLLLRLTGIPVVNDFRAADVKAGGQGAPLVPVYHQALAASLEKPVVFLNIGGVSNVTYVGASGELLAFDTGPGNALIDDWMLAKTGKKFDDGGNAARAGKPHEETLSRLLGLPFFAAKPPKSLDRDAFAPDLNRNLSLEDGAATISAFTVRAIAKAQEFFPQKPLRWIVCGGGRHNRFFMDELQKSVSAPVVPIETLGLDGDATEAEAFAYLAVRSVHKLPLSFPGTTGVKQPTPGGVLHEESERAA